MLLGKRTANEIAHPTFDYTQMLTSLKNKSAHPAMPSRRSRAHCKKSAAAAILKAKRRAERNDSSSDSSDSEELAALGTLLVKDKNDLVRVLAKQKDRCKVA